MGNSLGDMQKFDPGMAFQKAAIFTFTGEIKKVKTMNGKKV